MSSFTLTMHHCTSPRPCFQGSASGNLWGVESSPWIVTIDGPGASGKSSTARGVARALGVPYVSSGMLYRAVALLVLREGVDPEDEAATLEVLSRHRVELIPGLSGDRILIDGDDVTEALHTAEVDRVVSPVAKHPRVRAWVNQRLREMPPPFVVDGRDMGRVVFPEAPFKFFLRASLEVRALRRARERGEDPKKIEAELRARDHRDQAQTEPAPDAVLIDTSHMSLEEVVARVVEAVKRRAAELGLGQT